MWGILSLSLSLSDTVTNYIFIHTFFFIAIYVSCVRQIEEEEEEEGSVLFGVPDFFLPISEKEREGGNLLS